MSDLSFTVHEDGTMTDDATGEVVNVRSPYEFDARTFAARWLTVASAASEDPERFVLYRSVNVELDSEGVRLTSLDSYRYWTWWVGEAHDTPEPDYEADRSRNLTISDVDYRARDLMKWVMKRTKKEEDPPLTVGLSIGTMPTADGQMVGMEQPAATFSVWSTTSRQLHESLVLPVMEASYPDVRSLAEDREPEATVGFSPDLLTKMAKALPWGSNGSVSLEFAGEMGAVIIHHIGTDLGEQPLRGMLMPVRVATGDEATDG